MAQIPHGTFQAVGLIDTRAHPVAWDFYGYFPVEPIRPLPQTIAVTSRYAVNNMTWTSLMTAIVEHVPDGGSVLIVAHGTSRGIYIPLFAGGPIVDAETMWHMASSMNVDQNEAARIASGVNVHQNRAASRVGISVDRISEFRTTLRRVWDKRLSRVELRACNVGHYSGIVERIRSLLNARSFGCPRIRDSFFGVPRLTRVMPVGVSMQEWRQEHPNDTTTISWREWEFLYPHHRDYHTPYGRVSLYYQEGPHSTLRCELAADESRSVPMAASQSIHHWVNEKMPSGTWRVGPLPMHALVGWPPIFPGEPMYRSNLVFAENVHQIHSGWP